jgi:hypothetical protein
LVSIWLKHLLGKRDQAQEEVAKRIKELLDKADELKEKTIRERWDAFSKTQCEIKEKIDVIFNNMHDKVTWDHCNKEMKGFDERIREIGG